MRVLLCSPYIQDSKVVSGGINIWGHNILSYYQHIKPNVYLEPVSFDRHYDVKENSWFINRAYWGAKDYYSSIKKVVEKIETRSFDVLHLCTSAQLGLVKDLLVIREAHKRGVRVVLHLHFGRTPVLLKSNNWESYLFKKVIRKADAIVAIDKESYVALIESGLNKSYYLPNPLSLSIINKVDECSNSIIRIHNKILFVGHVIPSKGIVELVKACNNVDNCLLHIIGSITDEMKQLLYSISSKKNNKEWLIIRGGLSHEDVIKEMLSSCLFVLPSYTEGFPNVILEAMACGCAIVSTNVGAIPEMLNICSNEPCGLTCNPKDIDLLRCHIQVVLNNDSIIKLFSDRAKKRVRELYSIPIVWEQLVRIWSSVCSF